jgi:hypothetical protein
MRHRGIVPSRISAASRPAPETCFYTADAFAEWPVDWIGRHKEGPWLLYFPFNVIHEPHEATGKREKRKGKKGN